jgi:hypothetical protein
MCAYLEYDEDDEAWYCSVDMDEDDYAALMAGGQARKECPFFRDGDEYKVVRHQI